MGAGRNRGHRSRAAMPIRRWIVHQPGHPRRLEPDEQNWKLIAARCPSQAAKVWRESLGLGPADVSADELVITPAVWQWPSLPEPPRPRVVGEEEMADPPGGLGAFRGYGLWLLDDARCEGCDERTPRALMADRWVCLECALGPDDTEEQERRALDTEEELKMGVGR